MTTPALPGETVVLPGVYNKVALFGGVYNNYLALEAAIVDARRQGAEAIFCLGDLGGFGPHPDRVFPLLKQPGIHVMRGNYDESVALGLDDCGCGYTDPRDNYFAQISYDYTASHTSAANKEWLGTLPPGFRFELGSAKVLTCHGSPRTVNEFLWESTTSDAWLSKILGEAGADLIAGTHTGIKWKRRLKEGRGYLNTGALGRPENDGNTHVWYSLLSWEDGSWQVEFVPVKYDFERLAGEMREEGLPEEFVETILTGWWTTCLEILPAKERLRGKF